MGFSFYIAKRYFFAKKSQHAINIISLIAMIGVTVGTTGLITILSVFNGFGDLVISLYNSFDPDIAISPKTGKFFDLKDLPAQQIKNIKGVAYYAPIIEENALIRYKDKQYIGTIKGVTNEFPRMSGIDSMIIEGKMRLREGTTNHAVVGRAIAEALRINVSDFVNPLDIYVPKRGPVTMNPDDAFSNELITPSGIFAIQQDFDAKYVLVPFEFAQRLLDFPSQVSKIEISLNKNASRSRVKKEIQKMVGPRFEVKDRAQQHELLYKIMKSEKLAVYLILSLILMIATFNVISSLTMLIIDKKKDIHILSSMGAELQQIRNVFLLEGSLISLTGALIGLILGFVICYLQQRFGFIRMGSGFVVDAYPVSMKWTDFLYTFITVLGIGLFAAWYPAKKLVKEYMES